MRMMLPAAAALLIAGCVTINIYFPAAAAQKAADKIIDDVWQLQQPAQQPAPAAQPEPNGQSKP
jgi:hypothetical protein